MEEKKRLLDLIAALEQVLSAVSEELEAIKGEILKEEKE